MTSQDQVSNLIYILKHSLIVQNMSRSRSRNWIKKYRGRSHFQSRIGSGSFGAKVAQCFWEVDLGLLTWLLNLNIKVKCHKVIKVFLSMIATRRSGRCRGGRRNGPPSRTRNIATVRVHRVETPPRSHSRRTFITRFVSGCRVHWR
jgi:hypothetical protein